MLMDHPRSSSGPGEDNIGIPDDLRCKRSDGKQWRCTALSMPDKTVCEKHYIQAKKRAANSAMRASMKKGKRKSMDENDVYSESKSDDMDLPAENQKLGDYSGSISGKKHKEKVPKNQMNYFSETPQSKMFLARGMKSTDYLDMDVVQYDESRRGYRTPPPSGMESSRSRSQKMFDSSPTAETSEGSSNSSDNTGGQPCHQCRRNDHRVTWCLRCDRRGYCESCISTWYSNMPVEEIQRICPACRGSCNCKVCMLGDNLLKVRIREIPAQNKLQYLYSLLSAVLPVVKHIHNQQCFEVELEKKLRGNGMDLGRTKLNADEQMCCNFCRIPIVDYHRHCSNCSYDLCLSCCKDLRDATKLVQDDRGKQFLGRADCRETTSKEVKLSNVHLNILSKVSDWKADGNGSIPCPPKQYGGCSSSVLSLKRIFKMNWVAKLVKNVEEMVSGCKVCDSGDLENTSEGKLFQAAHRENGDDNVLYHPLSEDIRSEGIEDFRKQWSRGKPVIIKDIYDVSSMSNWDPIEIWRGVRETTEEKTKDDNRTVKAIDCFDGSEIDIQIGQFIRGYSEGRIHENGWPEMLKLKDWPSPSASEEFLFQRPEFISKLPLLEFIHSKWGLLNVAAKLPHYSLQNDVGPKIFLSYGMYEELGKGDSVNNLHINMRDLVFLLVHISEVKLKGWQKTKIGKMQKIFAESDHKGFPGDALNVSREGDFSKFSPVGDRGDGQYADTDSNANEMLVDQESRVTSQTGVDNLSHEDLNGSSLNSSDSSHSGALWDVFRRQDVPMLIEYLRFHWKKHGDSDHVTDDSVPSPLYDGIVYLNEHHKRKLKELFGIEPWSFEQHLGEAIFIPAGCPFQVRNLQSTVQLGLDFLSPESLGEAVRMAEEIRGLPNTHDAKLQMLEVGKISLYAASSAIKEVQKLVLDPKVGPELGFEDPNLTALVSENLEKMMKRREVA
ncbi:lysine-specific demethylase JMJ25 isoform X1 [Solanum verrucosum]|uniref:lysine-specific demethylase JMJ25 isoform X1 n=1 Tax=Solanum verrucosum TaxID=315347 RepID=UPI0020D0F1D6|nr:lysine-specific demethylase JMJ25 isoform X1 [Solanum verrucosum]XP_049357318.1 lysine-specific demethylase JMJ25 isoform X1 [Solanum verrucosum]XP_049357319.1 lysine-specific demethylase JMJ25 isoform X1 [Solanum verrucosum]